MLLIFEKLGLNLRNALHFVIFSWDRDGLAAMLEDSGDDKGRRQMTPLPCHGIGSRELTDAIDRKYNALHSKALWDMLRASGTGV